MKSVAIIGAGITGLTAAFYLKRRGIDVTVFEAASRPGGAIQSSRRDGFLAESGPNTILESSPKISQFIGDLNLAARKIHPDLNAKKRFLVRDGKIRAMPVSPLGFLTTKLFSTKAKLAVLREPFIPARRDGQDESVAEFVTRRLNREFLERAINPLVAGIYAGDPAQLSVQQAFPRLFQAEQKYGSLIRSQIFGARDRKKSGEIPRSQATLFSFDEGLQVLTGALAAQLGEALKLNFAVTKIVQNETGWKIHFPAGQMFETEFDAVIFCGTAHKLAKLEIENSSFSPAAGTEKIDVSAFSEIRHPPVASVVLGFRRDQVLHPLDGFGVLIPKIENRKILGTIFSSSLFPNRAPRDHVMLTNYVGGERQPELAALPPDKLVQLVSADLRTLLGVEGKPVFQNVALYPQAIPQYNIGYGKFKARLEAIETQVRGLFFAGNYRHGISLGDSIVSGFDTAGRLTDFLK
ncbi:MAG TPA: protoporphyrinogen oxidase [Verrucomicrobiae bacterium]|jgi:oxygen-dependent protoporphyrinogen oxidase